MKNVKIYDYEGTIVYEVFIPLFSCLIYNNGLGADELVPVRVSEKVFKELSSEGLVLTEAGASLYAIIHGYRSEEDRIPEKSRAKFLHLEHYASIRDMRKRYYIPMYKALEYNR